MNTPLIWIVEDDPRIAEIIEAYVRHSGWESRLFDRGDAVAAALSERQPDVLVLDVMLPGLDGVSVCRDIRRQHAFPIIMVTAKVEEIDRLMGFEVGADDYLCKPFSPRELVARLQALLRRSGKLSAPARSPDFEHDRAGQRIRYNRHPLNLTPQEYRLLAILIDHPGRIYSRAQLLKLAYANEREVFDRTVDSHIKNLRKKLQPMLGEREAIHSVYGVGYRFELTPD